MTTIDSPYTLGATLRAARKRIGLTQPELALAAGVGVRFIVDLEDGKPTVRLANVLRVIDARAARRRWRPCTTCCPRRCTSTSHPRWR